MSGGTTASEANNYKVGPLVSLRVASPPRKDRQTPPDSNGSEDLKGFTHATFDGVTPENLTGLFDDEVPTNDPLKPPTPPPPPTPMEQLTRLNPELFGDTPPRELKAKLTEVADEIDPFAFGNIVDKNDYPDDHPFMGYLTAYHDAFTADGERRVTLQKIIAYRQRQFNELVKELRPVKSTIFALPLLHKYRYDNLTAVHQILVEIRSALGREDTLPRLIPAVTIVDMVRKQQHDSLTTKFPARKTGTLLTAINDVEAAGCYSKELNAVHPYIQRVLDTVISSLTSAIDGQIGDALIKSIVTTLTDQGLFGGPHFTRILDILEHHVGADRIGAIKAQLTTLNNGAEALRPLNFDRVSAGDILLCLGKVGCYSPENIKFLEHFIPEHKRQPVQNAAAFYHVAKHVHKSDRPARLETIFGHNRDTMNEAFRDAQLLAHHLPRYDDFSNDDYLSYETYIKENNPNLSHVR
jgi:hypothetical protein